MDQLAPVNHIAELDPAPVLFITGADDTYATPADTFLLYERCRGHREICVVDGAGHPDIFEQGGVVYQQRILQFLAPRLIA
jgi:pimeloyl-ACP methyl ester carboxylesterase